MARSLWTGSLSFGLVNVPVAMFSGLRDVDLHFRQLHAKDAAPIDVQRVCSEEDTEVPYDEIAHGYELDSGKQVVLTDEELEAAAPERTRTIDIEQFVELEEVDPIFFDHPYVLAPASQDDGARRRPVGARGLATRRGHASQTGKTLGCTPPISLLLEQRHGSAEVIVCRVDLTQAERDVSEVVQHARFEAQ